MVVDATVVVAIIGAAQAVSVAIIGGLISRSTKRRESRDVRREGLYSAMITLLFATATGTEVLLHKAHGDKLNGNVESAISGLHDAKGDMAKAVNEEAAKLYGEEA